MQIKYAELKDKDFVTGIHPHINERDYARCVYTRSGYILWEHNTPIGFMSHCILWDKLPFLNLIYILDQYRTQGLGSAAMQFWENDMKAQGYQMVLTSTQADETAQIFYRKLGYIDCGALLFHNTPMEQPAEIFLQKVL